MNELDRIIVSRLVSRVHFSWDLIANPRWDHFTKSASAILDNEFNSYVEYENCGVIYRIVRRKDVSAYGIDPETAPGLSLKDVK